MKKRFAIILGAAFLVIACVAAEYHNAAASNNTIGTAIVIDTDMGLDDVRAIFALLSSGVDIHAIVTVEGSAAVGKGTDNIVGLLESIPRNDIAVYRGAVSPLHEPPPWRQTANTLGGSTFPPPRMIESRAITPEGLAHMLEQENEQFHYLALGPLGNIAGLVREHPDALSAIEKIWIPVKIDPAGAVTGWNLDWDPKAAVSVLRDAPEIILVDLSGAGAVDARKIFNEVAAGAAGTGDHETGAAGRAHGARWIARTCSGGDAAPRHFFLHDELAAAALIDPALLDISNESYRASIAAGGGITLEEHTNGNIYIGRIRDLARAIEILKSEWLSPIPTGRPHAEDETAHGIEHDHAGHTHGPAHPGGDHGHTSGDDADNHEIPTELLLRTFHGHLGPFVVLGYRMGKLALETAGSTGHFGIEADVYSILAPPPSCLIDGVQLGSGCTLGKRNIRVHETDGPAYADFTVRSGMKIRIALKPDMPGLVTRLVDERGVEAAGREVLGMKTEELFEIEITDPAGKN